MLELLASNPRVGIETGEQVKVAMAGMLIENYDG